MSINQLGAGSRWRRTTGQEIYSPLLLAFTHEKSEDWKASHLTKATSMDPNYSLPLNVALITLQELDDGNVLLRLAHLYEVGEDADHSTLANVELKKMFAGKRSSIIPLQIAFTRSSCRIIQVEANYLSISSSMRSYLTRDFSNHRFPFQELQYTHPKAVNICLGIGIRALRVLEFIFGPGGLCGRQGES
ncbi:unnamed protein product [Ilex paraguariensis]|uniref:Glycosyl hydrolases family 38 C-terminal beta sandwich domain-containing protein n=1 Tax=Ilex paraguariensis TaxID=185542 RepID=A0ABC8TQL2_9AQUA